MAYCGPKALRYAEFLEWDDLSRDAALAWQIRENDRCSQCGQAEADWSDENGIELKHPPFELVAHVCHSCSRLERYDAEARDKDGKLPAGLRHGWARVDPAVPDVT